MKYIAAYLLAQLGGNASPSCEDLKDILSSVGAEADDSRLSHLLSELDGRDIVDVIAEGKEKFASVPAGGAVAAAPSAAAGAAAAAAPETAKEAPKAEEPAEESDEDMGLGLFD